MGDVISECKPFRTYREQVSILESRGMRIEDHERAERELRTLNYYRLSGYWYTMRDVDSDVQNGREFFREGASFDLVMDLYEFDERLRAAILADLAPIELALRALVGHHLGRIDPLIHLRPDALGHVAKRPSKRNPRQTEYQVWKRRFDQALNKSKEEFAAHYREQYESKVPVWVAVELMDWGMLSNLYRMAPENVREDVAEICRMSAPQMESWIKCLNILRNLAAHHARIFNRGFDIKPKLSGDGRLDVIRDVTNRSFGQLTLIRYLSHELGLPDRGRLPAVLTSFPDNDLVPFSRIAAPPGWERHDLWVPLSAEADALSS